MKERLTGAIILVALVVVLVPELLNGPLRPAARAHGPLPPAEVAPLRSYTINLTDEPRGASGSLERQPGGSSPPAPAPAPAATASAAQIAPAPPSATQKPTAARATPAPPTPAPQAAAPAEPGTTAAPPTTAGAGAASGSGYLVQLGSFARRANAERLARQVRGQGFAVSVSRGTAGRRLYRVQVGPARERPAAEELAAKLRSQGHGGEVVAK